MDRILFITNLPSPYRVDFFNELAKYVSLTVLYQRGSASDRDDKWKSSISQDYETIFLKGPEIGVDSAFCPGVVKFLSKRKFDRIVICGVNSPTVILAITWCKLFRVPYYLEIDGGFPGSGKGLKEKFKHFVISGATGYFSTSDMGDKYLCCYGADKSRIHRYPFTSISRKDIAVALPSSEEKAFHRKNLGMTEEKIVLTVGRFSYLNGYGKGYDILMKIAEDLDPSIGIYIVGDEPTEEFTQWKESKKLDHVHFVGFKTKDELQYYYRAADLFIFLSRGDVWGLVVNEAMANGLPVISSDKAIAGLEMVHDGENGYVVSLDDSDAIKGHISAILNEPALADKMSPNALQTVMQYTFENCTEEHLKAFRGGRNAYKEYLRSKLGYAKDAKIVLGVGQFIPRKGFDVFIEVGKRMPDCLFLLVGGKPTEEYLSLAKGHENIRFIGFQDAAHLAEYYSLSDVLLMPTREDIWGLVVNEAMARGLPVVSTDKCVAALELVKNSRNGYIVKGENIGEIENALRKILTDFIDNSELIETICAYTIENMVLTHLRGFKIK